MRVVRCRAARITRAAGESDLEIVVELIQVGDGRVVRTLEAGDHATSGRDVGQEGAPRRTSGRRISDGERPSSAAGRRSRAPWASSR
jgi:hypothetical protein